MVYDSPHEHHRDDRNRRLALLIDRLPQRVRGMAHWLRQPAALWVRVPAGILLVLGSFLFILPVFGLWMLPLGLILLAEDIAPLRRLTDRWLQWIEQRRPHWMGLPPVPRAMPSQPERKST